MQFTEFLSKVTPIEWAVVGIALGVCLLGSLLPHMGNLLGRLLLGEDPLLARWQVARQNRRQQALGQRQARKAAKKAGKEAGISAAKRTENKAVARQASGDTSAP